MKHLLFFLLIIFPFIGKSEVLPRKMHELFFESDLIAEVKTVNNSDHDYTLKILDVYTDNRFGIKAGDYIKIKKDMNIVSSSEVVHAQSIINRKSGIAFLNKFDNSWSMGSISFFHQKKASIRFHVEGCEIEGSSSELKSQIREYFNEFKQKPDGTIHGKKSIEEVEKASLGQLSLIQYWSIYRLQLGFDVYSNVKCGELESKE